jgi:hypothetical protein
MGITPLSDELAQQALDVWQACGRSRTLSARELGLPISTFESRLYVAWARWGKPEMRPGMSRAKRPPAEAVPRPKPRYCVKADGSVVDAAGNQVQRAAESPEESAARIERESAQGGWAPEHGIDKPLPAGLSLKGTSVLYNAAGETQQYWNKSRLQGADPAQTVQLADPKRITKVSTLYDQQGRVTQQWVAERPEDAQREELWRLFAKELSADLPRVAPFDPPARPSNKDLMTLIPLGDPHFGMYAWAEETGNDFNLDIAKRDLCGAVDYLVSQAPPAEVCVIANLGDFFHSDNMDSVTPQHGHRLDVDTRLGKVIRVGLAAMRQAIDSALATHPTVQVINAVGNHDPVLSLSLSIMLSNIYEHEPRVKIHDQPTRRHYIRHGKVLIGVTHGDRTKDADLPGIMATERAQDWGLTKSRYWYRGHHHHDTRVEYNGCIVEQVRTLSPGDAYTVGGGWLSGRDMKLIVHHKEYGEVSRTTCSIDLLRSLE